MKRREVKEMIKAAFLAEMGSDAQYADEGAYGFYNEAEVYEGVDAAINKLADKVEDLPLVDKLAGKIRNNPRAMGDLNKLVSMYGGSMNEDLGGLDLATIVKKSQEFSDKVAEGNANTAVAGMFGGPLLVGLLNLVPGAMETLMQTVNSPLGIDASYYEPAFLLSVAGGVLVGAIIDKIKNNLNEAEDLYEEDLDEMLARLSEAEEEEDVDVEVDVKDTDLSADDEEVKTANDSIVVDKKIVSLSSLPSETRKILDTLETLRAQAEEFGDQKFMTQVGNTITFFTRDFVVAGDQPNPAGIEESLEILKMRKLAGLLTEGEYTKALLREIEEEKSDITELTSDEQQTLKALIGDVNEAMLDLGRVKDFAKRGLLTIGVLGALLGGPDLSAQQKQDVVNIAKTEMGMNVSHLVKKDSQDATTKVSTSDPMKQIRSEFPNAMTGRFAGGSSLNWGAHSNRGDSKNASAGLSVVYDNGSPFIQITISQVPGKSTTAYAALVKQANELARDGGKPQTDGNKNTVSIKVKKENVKDVITFLNNNVNNL